MLNKGLDTTTIELWKQYNIATNEIHNAMGGTANIVSEFAEKLVASLYRGKQMRASEKSADVIFRDFHDGGKEKLIQVKSRRKKKLTSSSLGIIRSWDFHYLVVVLFAVDGTVIKAIEIDVDTAKSIATPNKHQNGWVITTSSSLLENSNARDITDDLNSIITELK